MAQQSNLNNELISNFECIVCTEYMHPPIIQCHAGHSVCNRCYFKLLRCPTCRTNFDLRCKPLVLERLHSLLKFPCKNTSRGCPLWCKGYQIAEHEDMCIHRDPAEEPRPNLAESLKMAETQIEPVYEYLALLEEIAEMIV